MKSSAWSSPATLAAKLQKKWIGIISVIIACGSCVSGGRWFYLGHDSRALVIQTLNFYDQNSTSLSSRHHETILKGDWVFRRERLGLLDHALRLARPDVFIGQQFISRLESPTDADDSILLAGALSGFEIEKTAHPLTKKKNEEEFLLTAVSPPLRIVSPPGVDRQDDILLESDGEGFAGVTLIEAEGFRVGIINVDFKAVPHNPATFYDHLSEMISKHVETKSFCQERMVIAGSLPGGENSPHLSKFLSRFSLVDVKPAECRDKSSCPNASEENPLYRYAYPGAATMKLDYILVSENAEIINSSRSFNLTSEDSEYARSIGFARLPIAPRAGWSVEIKFPRCRY